MTVLKRMMTISISLPLLLTPVLFFTRGREDVSVLIQDDDIRLHIATYCLCHVNLVTWKSLHVQDAYI